jgi:FAD dependent oxidoreductase TIGR03364
MKQKSATIIGAGIVGLATALALAKRGYSMKVFERNSFAIGASVRNFGMLWPIGQATGPMYEQAMLSRQIWKEICLEAKIWFSETGSLHLAYHADERQVLQEYVSENQSMRNCTLLEPKQALELSGAINPNGLQAALWSGEEMIIESRVAIQQVAIYLQQKYKVEFYYNTAISRIEGRRVYAGKQEWQADEVFVCSGADFETLYPECFAAAEITKCKLQMLRFKAQPEEWRIGPSLCGGLSLIHYPGFKSCPTLPALKERYEREYATYLKWGIHVMVSQNESGELTIGDSHEYGLTHDPFDKAFINEMILSYLKQFAHFRDESVIQTWQGIYPKMTNGASSFISQPEAGVTIINGMGGNGMTLSFGMCEQYFASL